MSSAELCDWNDILKYPYADAALISHGHRRPAAESLTHRFGPSMSQAHNTLVVDRLQAAACTGSVLFCFCPCTESAPVFPTKHCCRLPGVSLHDPTRRREIRSESHLKDCTCSLDVTGAAFSLIDASSCLPLSPSAASCFEPGNCLRCVWLASPTNDKRNTSDDPTCKRSRCLQTSPPACEWGCPAICNTCLSFAAGI